MIDSKSYYLTPKAIFKPSELRRASKSRRIVSIGAASKSLGRALLGLQWDLYKALHKKST